MVRFPELAETECSFYVSPFDQIGPRFQMCCGFGNVVLCCSRCLAARRGRVAGSGHCYPFKVQGRAATQMPCFSMGHKSTLTTTLPRIERNAHDFQKFENAVCLAEDSCSEETINVHKTVDTCCSSRVANRSWHFVGLRCCKAFTATSRPCRCCSYSMCFCVFAFLLC